ncbi:MAG TPA: XrtB/PEP-CTERM-associated transcriptional regulator EpsA [Burkholderiales bacterium]
MSAAHELGQAGAAALLEPLDLEALLLNFDASLRVHSRPQLFGWTQGLLQSLVPHELLVCALCADPSSSFQADCFAGARIEPAPLLELFRRDTSLVPQAVKNWERGHFRPLLCDAAPGAAYAGGELAGELRRAGAPSVLLHGTYDAFGKPASLFFFAADRGDAGARRELLVELIVPFVHLAWMRSQVDRPAEENGAAAPRGPGLLTEREREILRWIHVGKSNIEIGTILTISPLTVKNHVQKILRKLNVQNRTQAVGKALALRILNL